MPSRLPLLLMLLLLLCPKGDVLSRDYDGSVVFSFISFMLCFRGYQYMGGVSEGSGGRRDATNASLVTDSGRPWRFA